MSCSYLLQLIPIQTINLYMYHTISALFAPTPCCAVRTAYLRSFTFGTFGFRHPSPWPGFQTHPMTLWTHRRGRGGWSGHGACVGESSESSKAGSIVTCRPGGAISCARSSTATVPRGRRPSRAAAAPRRWPARPAALPLRLWRSPRRRARRSCSRLRGAR